MSDLHIANRLFLPIDGVTETFAFLGRRGNGKTYAATLMAEQMLDAGAQIVALDPVGVWWGLRLMKDGVTPGYSIPVFGGHTSSWHPSAGTTECAMRNSTH